MKIGLDFDGVIANSHQSKACIAKERFGVSIKLADFRKEIVVDRGLLTADQYREVGVLAMNGSHSIPVVEGAPLYIPLLLNDGHQLAVITSRTEEYLESGKVWMSENGFPDLAMTGVGYGLPKTQSCTGLDIYVDDDLEKLLPLIGVVRNLFLFSWPWNAHETEPREIIRISCWWELYNLIRYEVE